MSEETTKKSWAADRNKAAPLPGKDQFGNLKSRWQSTTDTHLAKQRVLKGERPAGISGAAEPAPDWLVPSTPGAPATGSKIPVAAGARKEAAEAAASVSGPGATSPPPPPEKHVPTGAKVAPSALKAQFETKLSSHANKQKVLSGAMSAKAQAAEKAKREAEEAAARAAKEAQEAIERQKREAEEAAERERKEEEERRRRAERAEREAREEAERIAHAEAERIANAEAERVARAEAMRASKAEAEAQARERERAREKEREASARSRSSSRPPDGGDNGREGSRDPRDRSRDPRERSRDGRAEGRDGRDTRDRSRSRAPDAAHAPRSSSRAPDAATRSARSQSRAPDPSSRSRSSSRAPNVKSPGPSEYDRDWTSNSDDGHSEPASPRSEGEFGGRKVVHHVSGRHSVATSASEGEYNYDTESERGGSRRRRRRTGASESEGDEQEETTPTAEHPPMGWDDMFGGMGGVPVVDAKVGSSTGTYNIGGRRGAPTPPAKDPWPSASGRPPIVSGPSITTSTGGTVPSIFSSSLYTPPARGSSEAASQNPHVAAVTAAASLDAPASSLPALLKKISTEQLSQYLGSGPLYSSYERTGTTLRSQASKERLLAPSETGGSAGANGMVRKRSYNALTVHAAKQGELPQSPVSFLGIRPTPREGDLYSNPYGYPDRFGASGSPEVGRIWVSRATRSDGLADLAKSKGAVTPKLVSVKVDVNAWYPPSSRQSSVEAVESARALAVRTSSITSANRRSRRLKSKPSRSEYPAVRKMRGDVDFAPERVDEVDDDWDAWADEVLGEVVAAAAKAAEVAPPPPQQQRGRGDTREVRMEESPRDSSHSERGWKRWRFFSRVGRALGLNRKRSKTPERNNTRNVPSAASAASTGNRKTKAKRTILFGRQATM
ncbi:hypothetical protein HDU93_005999 [Gonapodya sp. JEL0774]|nr:hypothetical protein HDU93_005999 [Gonapodya sp. JEL0774]